MIHLKNLSALRKSKGWSQAKLGRLIDLSTIQIYKLETGRSFPRIDRLLHLVDVFGAGLIIESSTGSYLLTRIE